MLPCAIGLERSLVRSRDKTRPTASTTLEPEAGAGERHEDEDKGDEDETQLSKHEMSIRRSLWSMPIAY